MYGSLSSGFCQPSRPYYTGIQCPQLAGRRPTTIFPLSTPLVLGSLFQVRQEASGAQANAAGMRTWEDSLDSCTPLPFLPQGILVRRDTWRWRPLVRLIKKPFKLDEPVLYSLNAGLLGSSWQVPLCHLDERVSSASCTLIPGPDEKWEAGYTLKPLPCDPAQESESTDWSCFPHLPSPSCFCFI